MKHSEHEKCTIQEKFWFKGGSYIFINELYIIEESFGMNP
jgi:hypothetical protein